jgi:hypothetical protein
VNILPAVALGLALAAPDGEALLRTVGGAEVDWGAGVIRAEAGSAADYRLPAAEIARAGAERRARATAATELRAALKLLPLAGGRRLSTAEIDAAVARSRASIEYQSNGGAVATVSLRFAEVNGGASPEAEPKPPTHVLSVASMPLEVAPRLVAGDEVAALSWAVYRVGAAPKAAQALTLLRDREGRLVLPRGDRRLLDKLAGEPALIYVQKILK